jgi:hypothetical protein
MQRAAYTFSGAAEQLIFSSVPRIWLYKHHPLPPVRHLAERMFRSLGIAVGIIGAALFIGMWGYHHFGQMDWTDAFYNAAMILSGEGPAAEPKIADLTALHMFAGFYALFSGVTFITMVGVLLAPAIQRFLHKFHLEIVAPELIEMSHEADVARAASAAQNPS